MVEDSAAKGNLEERTNYSNLFKLFLKVWKKYPVVTGMSILLSVGLGASLYIPVFYSSPTTLLRERYQQLQAQYANTNGDNYISREEKEAFDKELFQGHGVVLGYTHLTCTPGDQNKSWQCQQENIPSLRYSSSGERVPPEIVLNWVNEFANACK